MQFSTNRKIFSQNIGQVMEIAEFYAKLGVKFIIINPSPISWDEAVDKTDDELIHRSKRLTC